jgi:hypothetical protein
MNGEFGTRYGNRMGFGHGTGRSMGMEAGAGAEGHPHPRSPEASIYDNPGPEPTAPRDQTNY